MSDGSTDKPVDAMAEQTIDGDAKRAPSPILTDPLGPSLFKFGMPLVVAMGLQAAFNLVDMVIVGRLPEGPDALSALVICDFVAMIATIFGNGISNASVAIIARRDAEGDFEAVSLTTAQSLSFTLIISIAFGIIGIVFADVMTGDIMGAKGDVHTYATEYMQVIVGGSFSILMLLQLVAILRAVGDAKTPMFLLVGSNILNLFLSVAMVYGPTYARSVWLGSTSPSFLVSSVAVCRRSLEHCYLENDRHRSRHSRVTQEGRTSFSLKWLLPIKKEIMRIWDIAWPNSAQYVVRVLILLLPGHRSARIHRYLPNGLVDSRSLQPSQSVQDDSITLFTGMGWGGAASTFVGQHLGARMPNRAVRAGWMATGYNCVWMLIVYGLYVLRGGNH